MAGKADQFLTKAAKQVSDRLRDETDLNLKLIMSAGILAFADLESDEKLEYVARAQMGSYLLDSKQKTLDKATPEELVQQMNRSVSRRQKQKVRFELLSPEEQELLGRFREQRQKELEADQLVTDAETEAAEARRRRNQGHKNTGS